MKIALKSFNSEYYKIWELGLALPEEKSMRNYFIKFTFDKNNPENYDRVCLKANTVSDAIERACYFVSYGSQFRPEEVEIHSVYDEDDNLLWIDEPYYNLIQKKFEFRGMERREFIKRFGSTSAAILYGLQPSVAHGILPFAFFKKNKPPVGQILITSSTSWSLQPGVTSICFMGVGGGGAGGDFSGGSGANSVVVNNFSVSSSNSPYTITIGAAGLRSGTYGLNGGDTVAFGYTAKGGGGGSSPANGGNYGNFFTAGTNSFTGGWNGGGAAGSDGNGGDGCGQSNCKGSNGLGSGAGGGAGLALATSTVFGGGAGGASLYSGAGGSGWGGSGSSTGGAGFAGGGASGGNGSAPSGSGGNGGFPGGAGGFCQGQSSGGIPGAGALRIIWGTGRSYPGNAS
jgi:hypothetical protein